MNCSVSPTGSSWPGRATLCLILALAVSGFAWAGDEAVKSSESSAEAVAETTVPAKKGLSDAYDSPESASREFLEVLAHGDRERILALALNREEFETLIYPTLPASRPGSNLSAEFVWRQSLLQSLAGLSRTMHYAGRKYELIGVRAAGGTKQYKGFVLLCDVRLKVRNEDGQERELRLFSSIIEMDGQYKIYSYRR